MSSRAILDVFMAHADDHGVVRDLSMDEIAAAAEMSTRNAQYTIRALEAHFWISTKQTKIHRTLNEKNVYRLLPRGRLWKTKRVVRASSREWAERNAGRDPSTKGAKRRGRSPDPSSRCAGPVALALPENVIGESVASRPADPEGREVGDGHADAPAVASPVPPSSPVVAFDDLDVMGCKSDAPYVPERRDPLEVPQKIRAALVTAGLAAAIGEGFEERLHDLAGHRGWTTTGLLTRIAIVGEKRAAAAFRAVGEPCKWDVAADPLRAKVYQCVRYAELPGELVTEAKPDRPREEFSVAREWPKVAPWKDPEPAEADRARAQNPAQGSTSSTPALPRVDAPPARAHVSGMSTEAAIARVRAALAATYHDEKPLAEHATEAVARSIVDRHTAGGANGGRLAVDDVVAVIAQYATFNAFKAKRKEMVPPPATLLRFLYAEIRNAQPGCAKTINAKLAETKFIPSKTQRQNFNKQPGDTLAHLDRPKVPLDMAKVKEALEKAGKPLVFKAAPPPPPPAEVYEDRITFLQRMRLQREKNGRT